MDTPSGTGGDQPPYVLRVAVGLWCALAVFLLLQSGLAWTGLDWLRQRLVEQQGLSAARAGAAARSLLAVNTAIAVVVAAAYAALTWFVWRRRAWARLAVTVLTVVHLLLILVTAALSTPNLIMLALAVAAWACCWRPSVTDWLTGGRG